MILTPGQDGDGPWGDNLKQFRGVATHYEKPLQNLAGFIWLAVLTVNIL
jgi:hypothetical protein